MIEEPMLSPGQIAELLGVHKKTVHLWLRTGKLQGIKISYRAWRIPKSAFDSFIEVSRNTKSQPLTRSSKKNGKESNTATCDQNETMAAEITTIPYIPPQSRMKYYIRDIMGEKPPE
jgi:excisionase family DNA binding protein